MRHTASIVRWVSGTAPLGVLVPERIENALQRATQATQLGLT